VLAFSIPVSDELVHKDSCLGCISAFAVPVLGMRTPDQRYPKYLIGMQSRCSMVSISYAYNIRWYFPTESVKAGFTTFRKPQISSSLALGLVTRSSYFICFTAASPRQDAATSPSRRHLSHPIERL